MNLQVILLFFGLNPLFHIFVPAAFEIFDLSVDKKLRDPRQGALPGFIAKERYLPDIDVMVPDEPEVLQQCRQAAPSPEFRDIENEPLYLSLIVDDVVCYGTDLFSEIRFFQLSQDL